jgi:hypothetical protein
MNANTRSPRNDLSGLPRTLRGNLSPVRTTSGAIVRQTRLQFRNLKRLCLPRNDSLQNAIPST